MTAASVDLESVIKFYESIRERKKVTPAMRAQLVKYSNELKVIVSENILTGQGHKAALSMYQKLEKLIAKHGKEKNTTGRSQELFV